MQGLRLRNAMVDRQFLAHALRQGVAPGQFKEETQGRPIIPTMGPEPRVRIPIRKGEIKQFDWTRIQILSESGLERRW